MQFLHLACDSSLLDKPENQLRGAHARVHQGSLLPAFCLVWLIASAILATPAYSQYRTSIQGTVTDPQGAVIPAAALTLKDLATAETSIRTSDPEGVFNFDALPADHFSLTVERSGFKKKVLDDLQLIPEQPNALKVELEIERLLGNSYRQRLDGSSPGHGNREHRADHHR